MLGQRALESGIETISIDSADDLIGGRTAAEAYGKMWGAMTGDEEAGIQFTRDLIEGNKASVQPFLRLMHSSRTMLLMLVVRKLLNFLVFLLKCCGRTLQTIRCL